MGPVLVYAQESQTLFVPQGVFSLSEKDRTVYSDYLENRLSEMAIQCGFQIRLEDGAVMGSVEISAFGQLGPPVAVCRDMAGFLLQPGQFFHIKLAQTDHIRRMIVGSPEWKAAEKNFSGEENMYEYWNTRKKFGSYFWIRDQNFTASYRSDNEESLFKTLSPVQSAQMVPLMYRAEKEAAEQTRLIQEDILYADKNGRLQLLAPGEKIPVMYKPRRDGFAAISDVWAPYGDGAELDMDKVRYKGFYDGNKEMYTDLGSKRRDVRAMGRLTTNFNCSVVDMPLEKYVFGILPTYFPPDGGINIKIGAGDSWKPDVEITDAKKDGIQTEVKLFSWGTNSDMHTDYIVHNYDDLDKGDWSVQGLKRSQWTAAINLGKKNYWELNVGDKLDLGSTMGFATLTILEVHPYSKGEHFSLVTKNERGDIITLEYGNAKVQYKKAQIGDLFRLDIVDFDAHAYIDPNDLTPEEREKHGEKYISAMELVDRCFKNTYVISDIKRGEMDLEAGKNEGDLAGIQLRYAGDGPVTDLDEIQLILQTLQEREKGVEDQAWVTFGFDPKLASTIQSFQGGGLNAQIEKLETQSNNMIWIGGRETDNPKGTFSPWMLKPRMTGEFVENGLIKDKGTIEISFNISECELEYLDLDGIHLAEYRQMAEVDVKYPDGQPRPLIFISEPVNSVPQMRFISRALVAPDGKLLALFEGDKYFTKLDINDNMMVIIPGREEGLEARLKICRIGNKVWVGVADNKEPAKQQAGESGYSLALFSLEEEDGAYYFDKNLYRMAEGGFLSPITNGPSEALEGGDTETFESGGTMASIRVPIGQLTQQLQLRTRVVMDPEDNTRFEKDKIISNLSIIPNPARAGDMVGVSFKTTQAGVVSLRFSNSAGSSVFELTLENGRDLPAGEYRANALLPSMIPQGAYLGQIMVNGMPNDVGTTIIIGK